MLAVMIESIPSTRLATDPGAFLPVGVGCGFAILWVIVPGLGPGRTPWLIGSLSTAAGTRKSPEHAGHLIAWPDIESAASSNWLQWGQCNFI